MPFLVVVILIVAVGYLISLRIHPLTKCRLCKASGRHFGVLYSQGFRRCRKCGGSGRRDRLGTKVFFGGTDDTGIFRGR